MVAAHAPHQRGEANRRSDAIKRLLTLAALGLALAAPATAHAAVGTPRSLISVHAARDQTWHWQDLAGHAHTPYGWLADRHTTTSARRWQIATAWWDRAAAAHTAYMHWQAAQPAAPAGPPASFWAKMPCLARAEEYGPPGDPKGGENTTAGYFGMVYPPSAYPTGSGSSWLALSYSQQVLIVYAEWLAKGSSPWPNTAPGCGL